jgi:F0F1-type ATP synthase membrane subunit b/b'
VQDFLYRIFLSLPAQFNLKQIKKGEAYMPYKEDKQHAFLAAQQGVNEAQELYNDIVQDSANYGHQLKHLKKEVNEAYAQIENALEVASETQRAQLERFQQDLQSIVTEVNMTE